MGAMRRCSKTGCQRNALATLTYNYADSAMVIGPLSRRAEPHTYDLCGEHAAAMTAPKGWEVLRLELPERYEPVPGPDDLLAVANALRPQRAPKPVTPTASSSAPPRAPQPQNNDDGPVPSATSVTNATPSRPSASRPTADGEQAPRPSLGGPDGPARPGRGGLRVIRGSDETD